MMAEVVLFLLALAIIIAIVSLCMVGVGEGNSFRSWAAIILGSMLLIGLFAFMANEIKILSNSAAYSLMVNSFFAMLFGLVTLKYLVGIGMNHGESSSKHYSLLIRAYLSAIIFLSLLGIMSWAIAIGGALVVLGYLLIQFFDKRQQAQD